MLQTIREHTQGWIAGVIVSIIILSFALWGIHSYFVGGGNSNIVAEVNGVEISKEQFTLAYERMRRQAQAQYGTPVTTKDENNLKSRALQGLIELEVLKQASRSQGFLISNAQIDNYLQSMPEFQVDGQFSVDRFQEVLSSTMMSTIDFLELIRTSLLIDQPRLGILLTSFSTPDETDYTYSLVNQERDIAYITIPLAYFQAQPIVITPAQINAYYEAHKSDFMTPEQVTVEYVQLSISNLIPTFKPTDAVLKTFYSENINSYTQPSAWQLTDIQIPLGSNPSPEEIMQAQGKADAVVDALNKGADFATLAAQYISTNLDKKGLLTLNQVPAELQRAVAEMNKVNQVSEVVRTATGFVIVKVMDYREPKIQPFEVVKDKVNETYAHQHAEEKFAELRDQLADLTYEHPDSLVLASKNLNLPIQTSELFVKDKAGKDISQYKKVRETAFSNDVLNLQNNSDVIQLNPENVIVIRVKSHIPSSLLPLNDISKQIEDKLKTEVAEKRLSLIHI